MSDPAPYFAEITAGAETAETYWITAQDGVRLRVGVWHAHAASQGPKGTVILFPGRTEYVEKYADTAAAFAQHGLSSIAIDWRGQGIADRLIDDPRPGHVNSFSDYQLDVAAMLHHVRTLDLPQPWFLLGHSMGGCIGLRAAMDGLPVKATAFSGPMWGIHTTPFLRPVMWVLTWVGRHFGFGHRYPPTTTGPKSYILDEPFDTNGLTRDAAMYQLMRDQLTARPELQLGAPSLTWLYEALTEMRGLARRPSPDLPCLTIMGSQEAIVDQTRVKTRMGNWPNGTLHIEPGGRHELLMEDAATRTRLADKIAQHFLNA